MKPYVGRVIHYVSYGTPGGEYHSECRAAIVTEVRDVGFDALERRVGLCALNPTGQFFNRDVPYHDGDLGLDASGASIPARSYRGGSWHFISDCAGCVHADAT